ncbi:Gfo/Idh/MocA family protein [Paenibacillaceae bacterium WGS1546]|uniref:Gfo/Idh/MocA family protein n=1 Tax=Cohnella sp. WGS1546 TaxID=3366810 RepID=UPI00372D6C3E
MRLGVIGYGSRIRSLFGNISEKHPDCRIAAIADPRHEEIRTSLNGTAGPVDFYADPDDMLDRADLDGVIIGTRCNLHAEMAIKALRRDLPLYLEKPVATTYEDLDRLKEAYEASRSEVVVSFPLRNTPLVKLAKEIVASGKIGTVEHVQAVNNVPYGGVYYHSWYRDERITGGLFLQKATHDFDYINALLGMKPVEICAMKSKQVFKGSRPAGLKCADCEDNRVCGESALKPENRERGEYCSFAADTGNEDSGSALLRYESGMHAVDNFLQVVRGEARSETTLADGLLSALLCLKANESAETNAFKQIEWERCGNRMTMRPK